MSSETLPRVAILDDYQGVAQTCADWSALKAEVSIDVFRDTIHDEDALVERLESYNIICTMRERTKLTKSVLDRLPNLKMLATTGMRQASIDVAAARANGVVVCGTEATGKKGGAAYDSTLEHTWALILGVARHLVHEHANVARGKAQWQTAVPLGLSGKTLGIIGLGILGKNTAAIAKAFGMRVLAWSPNLTRERVEEAGVDFASSKHELFSTSDIISVHMLLAPSTRHLIAASEFDAMQPHAFLVNTSRGPIVDETAMIDALQTGKIAGAALDVYNTEPLLLDHPLRTLPNVTLSPHNAYVNDDAYKMFYGQTVENILAFLDAHPIREIGVQSA